MAGALSHLAGALAPGLDCSWCGHRALHDPSLRQLGARHSSSWWARWKWPRHVESFASSCTPQPGIGQRGGASDSTRMGRRALSAVEDGLSKCPSSEAKSSALRFEDRAILRINRTHISDALLRGKKKRLTDPTVLKEPPASRYRFARTSSKTEVPESWVAWGTMGTESWSAAVSTACAGVSAVAWQS